MDKVVLTAAKRPKTFIAVENRSVILICILTNDGYDGNESEIVMTKAADWTINAPVNKIITSENAKFSA